LLWVWKREKKKGEIRLKKGSNSVLSLGKEEVRKSRGKGSREEYGRGGGRA